MNRWRLTYEQNGNYDVSTVVLGDDEWQDHLADEAHLHRKTGWQVAEVRNDDDALVAVVCRRGSTTRVISARESTPWADEVPGVARHSVDD